MDAGPTDGNMRVGQTPERIESVSTIALPTVTAAEPPAVAPPARRPLGPSASEAAEREQLLDRLQSLRRVLPVLAQEMAAARRQAARLRTDNRKLVEQVRMLRADLKERERKA
jgi:hypothetical protein